ncbi:AAA family ATPase [Desulfofarcimen acetoxidans]|nr:AAA family ATPase [Desulfofarcimen acetoxidans]
MELLYIWINNSENNFIVNEGFNLYGEHRFTLQVREKYILSYESRASLIGSDLYCTGCIKNITAIVGENGSGKTTLFKSIYLGSCLPYQQHDDPKYHQMNQDDYEMSKRILIYQFGNNIEIIHNLELGRFVNNTPFVVHNINEADQEERLRLLELLEQQTIIYLSNSRYTSDLNGYGTHGNLNKISLTADSLKNISGRFYRKIVQHPQGLVIKLNPYNILQSILIKNKTVIEFQQVCDVLYYHHLYSRGYTDLYISKLCKDLYVDFSCTIPIIEKVENYRYIAKDDFKSEDPHINRLSAKIKEFSAWCYTIPIEMRGEIFTKQCLNLIFEMFYCWDNIELNKHSVTSMKMFPAVITDIIDSYKRQQGYDSNQSDYYEWGLKEIEELNSILCDCKTIYSNVPEYDLAHRFDKVISYESNKKQYLLFCRFINQLARKDKSVLLKYIKIDNLHMSSGERAIQNFFSWLNLLPFFDEFIEGEPIRLRESALLLIDEIDLYMHPEWQRKLIKVLFNELSTQFEGKEIQVIISTHSPLVLSDILRQNTIYLQPKEGMFHLIDADSRAQTFGNNIYTLLNDSFFMKSTIGDYAKEIIKEISDNLILLSLDPGNSELRKKCEKYSRIIESIGEPLIHKKLQHMFFRYFENQQDTQLKVFRKQVQALKKSLHEKNPDKKKIEELKESLKNALAVIESISGDIE